MDLKKIILLLIPLLLYLFVPLYPIQVISMLLISVLLFSLLFSGITYKFLQVNREPGIKRGYLNTPVEVSVTLKNRSPLPLFHLLAIEAPGGLRIKKEKRKILYLPPLGKLIITYQAFGAKRGEYSPGPLTIKAADPMGLFPWSRKAGKKEQVIIYPEIFKLTLKEHKGMPSGNIIVTDPLYEDTTYYKSIRPYIPGDDLRRVNWKASAAMGRLQTMIYTPTLYYSTIILLNMTERNFPLRHRYSHVEKAVQLAASLLFYSINRSQEAGLFTNGKTGEQNESILYPPAKSHSHGMQILEILAKITPTPQEESAVSLFCRMGIKLPPRCRIMYVGPPLEEAEQTMLLAQKAKGIETELFLIYDERRQKKEKSSKLLQIHYIGEMQRGKSYGL